MTDAAARELEGGMNVKELRDLLSTMPDDATVRYIWDGEARSTVRHAWLSRGGDVMLADEREVVYSTSSRPLLAPGDEDRFWETAPVTDDAVRDTQELDDE